MMQNILESLNTFAAGNLTENALHLFQTLGYGSERRQPFYDKSFIDFEDYITEESNFNRNNALSSNEDNHWVYVDLLFQLTESELKNQNLLFADDRAIDQHIVSYLFFVIELKESGYNRTALNQITREVNKVFEIPVMILFKYGEFLTLSVINRRPNQINRDKTVLEKVTLIKDIKFEDAHRAHLEILKDVSLPEVKTEFTINSFIDLHNAWQKILSTKKLNKDFYDELFKWYLWAVKNVRFPQIRPEADKIDDYLHQNESVIRLLTRLLFCWFMKEKQQLISKNLFDENYIEGILKGFSAQSSQSNYYRAILQNLFFATLSVPIDERKYIKGSFHGTNKDFGNPNVFRYQDEFVEPKDNLQLFKSIPFLNGGLFECLDERPENGANEIRLDGFSSNEKKQAFVPNLLFWGEHTGIDLSKEFDNPRKNNEKVQGIFDILNSFKFTIEENTPLDEEIALDPDLLGRTFENLLASYNPETKASARKQTGSFYTPREIVNYMVDESLIAYLKQKMNEEGVERDIETKLRKLVSFNNAENVLRERESTIILRALENLKVFDPACGSGAFPMGILQKLVLLLRKIDPENKKWFESLINRLPEYIRAEMRTKLEGEDWDYLRKLGIIQQSIYGADIQPIAIQIAKLRFFISLLVDQKIKDKPENNFGLLPLPNLDFKLVCANSLVSVPEENADEGFQFEDLFFEKFTQATEKYFSTYDPKEKKKLTNSIEPVCN